MRQSGLLLQQPLSGPWAIDSLAVTRSAGIPPADSLPIAIPVADVPYGCHAASLGWMQEDEESIQCRLTNKTDG